MKSFGSTPFAIRYFAAGLSSAMEPAGEMWSVVMLSPMRASTRAPWMSSTGGASRSMSMKYGGSLT